MSDKLTIHVGCPQSQIEGAVPPQIAKMLERKLSFRTEGSMWAADSLAQRSIDGKGVWDGVYRHFDMKTLRFPTGMLRRVCHWLTAARLEFTVTHPEAIVVRPADTTALRDYQAAALTALASNPWGQLMAPPRSGKTAIGAFDILQHDLRPAVVLFPGAVGITPVYQLHRELQKWTGLPIGIVGDQNHEIQDITVMSTASAYEALVRCRVLRGSALRQHPGDPQDYHHTIAQALREARYLLLDESHMHGGDRERAVLRVMRQTAVRHGLSGTPWKDDGTGFQTEAVVGPVIHRIERGPLVERGYLVPILVDMQRMPHLTFPRGTAPGTIYKAAITESPERNEACARWVAARVDEGHCGVVIVTHKKHGRRLRELIPGAQEIYGMSVPEKRGGGETTGKQRERLLDDARAGRIPVIISTVMDMAVDVPAWSFVALACGGKDSAWAEQRVSRAATADGGKTVCKVWDAMDHAKNLTNWATHRLNLYINTAYCDVRLYDLSGELEAATGGVEKWQE